MTQLSCVHSSSYSYGGVTWVCYKRAVIPLYTDDDDTPKGPALIKDLDFEQRIKALKKEFSKTDST